MPLDFDYCPLDDPPYTPCKHFELSEEDWELMEQYENALIERSWKPWLEDRLVADEEEGWQ